MKRKLLTLAMVSALSAACVFGAAACNKDDDGNKGGVPNVGDSIQVKSEAEWKQAFNGLGNNYSFYERGSLTDYSSQGLSATYVANFYMDNVGYYYETIGKSGALINQKNCSYFENGYGFAYTVDDVWVCDSPMGDVDYFSIFNACFISFSDFAVSEMIENYFSEFTFQNGAYVRNVDEGHIIKLKISGDGYLSYLYGEGWLGDTRIKVEYTFYNYGTTSFDAPEEAKQAIADYKAAQSNN